LGCFLTWITLHQNAFGRDTQLKNANL
jgi:hypothetical protein